MCCVYEVDDDIDGKKQHQASEQHSEGWAVHFPAEQEHRTAHSTCSLSVKNYNLQCFEPTRWEYRRIPHWAPFGLLQKEGLAYANRNVKGPKDSQSP